MVAFSGNALTRLAGRGLHCCTLLALSGRPRAGCGFGSGGSLLPERPAGGRKLCLELAELVAGRMLLGALAGVLGRHSGLLLGCNQALAQVFDRSAEAVDDLQQRVLAPTELLELDAEGAPSRHEVGEGAIAEVAGFGDHAPALLLRGVEELDCVRVRLFGHGVGFGLRLAGVLVGLLLGRGANRARLGPGKGDLFVEDSLGPPDHLGGLLLGLHDRVACSLVRGGEDLGRLDANCLRERRLVELGVGRPALGIGKPLAQYRLTLEGATELRRHLAEIGTHGFAVDALAHRREGLARYLVRADGTG